MCSQRSRNGTRRPGKMPDVLDLLQTVCTEAPATTNFNFSPDEASRPPFAKPIALGHNLQTVLAIGRGQYRCQPALDDGGPFPLRCHVPILATTMLKKPAAEMSAAECRLLCCADFPEDPHHRPYARLREGAARR